MYIVKKKSTYRPDMSPALFSCRDELYIFRYNIINPNVHLYVHLYQRNMKFSNQFHLDENNEQSNKIMPLNEKLMNFNIEESISDHTFNINIRLYLL